MIATPVISRPPERVAAYVRRARRLRAVHRGETGRLHGALRELSVAKPAAAVGSAAVVAGESGAVRFANRVAVELQGGILRYSARLSLLSAAARMGIERFEANLIIAAVQHGIPKVAQTRRERKTSLVLRTVGVVAIVQGLIVLAAWWTLVR